MPARRVDGSAVDRSPVREHGSTHEVAQLTGGTAMTDETYEVFAIKYATRNAQRREHFVGGDPHDAPMPMDYFVWLIRNGKRTFVVDTGFTREVGEARKRTFLRSPSEGLALMGVKAADVENVIITHM